MPRLIPFLVFVAIALGLVSGMHYYLWARLVRDPQLPETWARILTVTIVALGVAMAATLFAARLLPGSVARPAIWVSFIWMGVGFLLVAFLGLADLARLVAFVVAIRTRRMVPSLAAGLATLVVVTLLRL